MQITIFCYIKSMKVIFNKVASIFLEMRRSQKKDLRRFINWFSMLYNQMRASFHFMVFLNKKNILKLNLFSNAKKNKDIVARAFNTLIINILSGEDLFFDSG